MFLGVTDNDRVKMCNNHIRIVSKYHSCFFKIFPEVPGGTVFRNTERPFKFTFQQMSSMWPHYLHQSQFLRLWIKSPGKNNRKKQQAQNGKGNRNP